MPTENSSSYMFGGMRVEISVSSSGTGLNKVYVTTTKIYDRGGNLSRTDVITHPIIDSNMLQMPSFIPKNTVRVTTPLSVDNDEIGIATGNDGISFLCCGCTKLETLDLTTDLIHNVPSTSSSLKGNFADYAFFGCESLKTLNVGDYFSCFDLNTPYNAAANQSLYCFAGCVNLETITGVFNFADDQNVSSSTITSPAGWNELKKSAEYMFYGCDKLTGVQIHLTGDSTSFISDKVYETLGLKLNQFTLV